MQQRGPSGPNHYQTLKDIQRDAEENNKAAKPEAAASPSEKALHDDWESIVERARVSLDEEQHDKVQRGLIKPHDRRYRMEKFDQTPVEEIVAEQLKKEQDQARTQDQQRTEKEKTTRPDVSKSEGFATKELTDAQQARLDRLSGPSRPGNEKEMGPNDNEGPNPPGNNGRNE